MVYRFSAFVKQQMVLPSTFIYAIDTWKETNMQVFMKKNITKSYLIIKKISQAKSRLVRSSFDEAAEKFQMR